MSLGKPIRERQLVIILTHSSQSSCEEGGFSDPPTHTLSSLLCTKELYNKLHINLNFWNSEEQVFKCSHILHETQRFGEFLQLVLHTSRHPRTKWKNSLWQRVQLLLDKTFYLLFFIVVSERGKSKSVKWFCPLIWNLIRWDLEARKSSGVRVKYGKKWSSESTTEQR